MAEAKDSLPDLVGVSKRKHRSPNYPVMSLRKAVERVEALAKQYRRHLIPIGLVQTQLGYKSHSSAGNQSVAALKAYGLLDVEGDGDNRQVRLSELGYRVALGHAERAQLLKKAALSPALHAEIWEKYKADGLPDGQVIRHYLVFDRNFNTDSVDSFIANFRDSLVFAGLIQGDIILDDGDDKPADYGLDQGVQDSPASEAGGEKPARHTPPSRGKPMAPGTKEDVFTLDEGPVVLQYPERLSPESFEDFESWLQLVIRKAKRSIRGASQEVQSQE